MSTNIITEANTKKAITPLFATDYHVYINHTDAGGIVYHANHLVFFENCRRDWFTELGLNGYFLQTDNGQVQHFVVSQAELQYRKPIFLDEKISVRVDKVELKPASIVFYQSIHRHLPVDSKPSDSLLSGDLLSSAKIVIACVQNQIKPDEPSIISDDTIPAVPTVAIRPIRVPKKLYDSIQNAISQQTTE